VPLSEAPTVLNNIGYTFMTIERYPEAIQVLQAAVQLRPNYLRAWQNLAGSAMAVGEFAIARDAYFSAIALEGEMTPLDNSNLCLAMAETQSDSAQTLGYCQRAVDADPENAMFVGRTAHALLLMNQPQAAAVIAQQAVQMQPPLSLNFRVLGDAYRILGFPAEAELAYREALRIDPDNAAARDGLAALGVTP
jgi:tetratricopeptide (TPR) repeat protein